LHGFLSSFSLSNSACDAGYLCQRADGRDLPTLGQGNWEPLAVKDKVESSPGELGLSKFVECDNFSFQCFDTLGWATGRASGL